MIISDKGPGYVGPQWGEHCQMYSLVHIGVPTLSSHSNGIVERQIGLAKEGYRMCKGLYPDWSDVRIIQHVVCARNIVPVLSPGVAPLSAMTGRNDVLASLEECPALAVEGINSTSTEYALSNAQGNVMRILELRNHLSRFEASRIASVCAGRRLRTGSKETISVGDMAEVFSPSQKLWKIGYRVVGIVSSHAVIECGKQMIKHPLAWIRKRRVSGQIIPANDDIIIVPMKLDNEPSASDDCIDPNRAKECPSSSSTDSPGMPRPEVSAPEPTTAGVVCVSTDAIADLVNSATENSYRDNRNPFSHGVPQGKWINDLSVAHSYEDLLVLEERNTLMALPSKTHTLLEEEKFPPSIDPSRIPSKHFPQSNLRREAIKRRCPT